MNFLKSALIAKSSISRSHVKSRVPLNELCACKSVTYRNNPVNFTGKRQVMRYDDYSKTNLPIDPAEYFHNLI
ncbi:hypothetical protein D3C81_1672070 [compost metagenome]